MLCFHDGRGCAICARGEAFGGVGADELGPVAGKKLRVGEEIGPDDFAMNGDDDANGVLLAKLGENLFAGFHYGCGGFVDFIADGVGLHDLGVAGGAEGRRGRRRSACCGWGRGGHCHLGDGSVHGIPYLLLIFLGHGPFADGGLNHEAVRGSFGGRAEGGGTFSPAAWLDAEDSEIDGIGAGWDDAVFGDDAVLLTTSDDFAGEEQERPFGVVDEDEGVDLVGAIGVLRWAVGGSASGTEETLDAAGFGDFYFSAFDSFIEGDEGGFDGRFAGGMDYGEQEQVAALDGSEYPEWTAGVFDRAACGADVISLVEGCECEE